MILLIDNYDSFAYNLYQLIGTINPDIKVIRNDELTVEEIDALKPEKIVISPGPGKPADAGICIKAVKYFEGKVPILGVCLGHQAICEAYGGTISYAKTLMHGKQSKITLVNSNPLFKGLADKITVGRYHSLSVMEKGFPEDLKIVAKAEDGEIMAVSHKKYKTYGVQFHPESILTLNGKIMMENFLRS